jgi:hypothetical protein
MKILPSSTHALAAALVLLLMSGCVANPPQSEKTDAAAPPASASKKADVKESTNKESGKESAKPPAEPGKTVKGISGWEGEISGKPAANSKFKALKIGMSMKQSTDLAGQPSDQGAYMTGKAWIPFYFGSDRHRYEMVFKGQGRLVFAGGSLGDYTGGNLIMIIHNSQEGGYR